MVPGADPPAEGLPKLDNQSMKNSIDDATSHSPEQRVPPSTSMSASQKDPNQDYHSGELIDVNWALNLLLDPNQDLLSSFDFTAHPNSNLGFTGTAPIGGATNDIAHKIQYQDDVHSPHASLDGSIGPMYGPQMLHPIGPAPHLASQMGPQIGRPSPQLSPDSSSVRTNSSLQQQAQIQPQAGGFHPQLQNQNKFDLPSQLQPSLAKQNIPDSRKQRRPCDHCRRRKTKCVIIPGTNNCVQCESKSLTCTYVQPVSRNDSSIEDQLSKRACLPGKGQYNVPRPNDYDMHDILPPNVPIRDVPPIQDYLLVNNSLLKKTLSLQFPRSSFFVGPTSYLFESHLMDSIILSHSQNQGSGDFSSNRIEQVNLSDSISLRKVGANGDSTKFILKDDQTPQSYQTMSNDVDAIERFIAPHGQVLIDLYFRIIHPSYPILHKKVFLEKYSRTHREFSAPLLAAVYVLAIQWWDYDPQLNRFPKPNVDLILKIALNNYLRESLKRPKLSAVQAGLLLLQCKHMLREYSASKNTAPDFIQNANASLSSSFSDSDYNDWVLCSQVVALSEELGLGLDCDRWKLPKWERGLRKRLAWAVFMEDKWLSLTNGRPSHIDNDNWIVLQLLEEDFPEKHGDGDLKEGSSDINNGKKNFMNLVELSRILSDILSSLYSMRAMRDIWDINEVLKLAKPIQLRLRTWYRSLPVELQMASVQPRKLCSNGYLQLAYFATELTLHRKIITIMHRMASNGQNIPKELTEVCRTAAKTRLLASIEFVRDLKPEHIHSFWHSAASANFGLIGTFAALLYISSPTKEEADFYKDQIFNYRWILKISSKGFVQVGSALDQLDLVFQHVPKLLNENLEQSGMSSQTPAFDYNKFYQQNMQARPQPVALPNAQRQRPASVPYNGSFEGSRPSPKAQQLNSMSRHNPAQQQRTQLQSPHDTKLTRSPQSSQGLSPKEMIKTQRPASNTTGNGKALERRGSFVSHASHASETVSMKETHSSKASSPLVTRSPVAHSQSLKVDTPET